LLAGLEERGCHYVCAVESTFGLRLPEEVEASGVAPPYQGRGQPRKARPAPLHTAEALAKGMGAGAWVKVAWREGRKGELAKEFAFLPAHRATGGREGAISIEHSRVSTGPLGWLLIERPLPGHGGEVKYYYANLPGDCPPERLVSLAHARWAIEQFYEDGNGECGLDDFQGRSWEGLHRHLALVLLTYSFLVSQRLKEGSAGEELFPPQVDLSFPAAHRLVLSRLFQDLVLFWLGFDPSTLPRPP
jgi:SRSO17 transposase